MTDRHHHHHHNITQPMFAPVSSQQPGGVDDIDFNEVFAEYFINEFEDPMNAYTGGMANFVSSDTDHLFSNSSNHGATAAAASTTDTAGDQKSSADRVHLPTGGIRTAFHAKSTSSSNSATTTTTATQQKFDVLPTPLSAMMAQPPVLSSTGPAVVQTATTTGNQPETTSSSAATTNTTTTTDSKNTHTQLTFAKGITLQQAPQPPPGSSLANNNNNTHNHTQQLIANPNFLQTIVNHHPLLASQLASFPQQQQQLHQTVALPIGVGIRLGGIGGVVAAASNNNKPVVQYKHPWANPTNDDSGDGENDKTLAERRERNREHAKRSRVRKKFMLESLQEQVRELQKDNKNLRLLIQEHIPDQAVQIFAECCSQSVLFADDESARKEQQNLDRKDFALMQALSNGQQCFVLSDPKLPDNPIIFASPGFYKMTGYTDKEVLGRNCRFLQGQGTDPKSVDVIRKAIASGSDMTVCLLNYKADGTPFWNQFFIAALRDSDNNIVNYVGVQTEVSPEKVAESNLEDKVNAVLPLQNSRDEKS